MNALALTVPVTRISVPALLVAAAATAAVVSTTVLVLDERTVVTPPQPVARTVVDQPQTPGDAYAEMLERRHQAYLDSLPEE